MGNGKYKLDVSSSIAQWAFKSLAATPYTPYYIYRERPYLLDYLILRVMMVRAAKMMVIIQKRMVIFDSCTAPLGFFST